MLYDPKWEVETKTDPFEIKTLIAWLEKQPADEGYEYADCKGACLLGQYMTAQGIDWYGGLDGKDAYTAICDRTDWGAMIALAGQHTFGAALKRARALL